MGAILAKWKLNKQLLFQLFLLFILFLTSGCTMKYIADHDAAVFTDIVSVSKKMDVFFATLLETPKENREFNIFSETYIDIESDLNSLLVRYEIRELNAETIRNIGIVIKLWKEDKADHQKKNTVSDFIAKTYRDQYNHAFIAMAKAKAAKHASENQQ